MSAEGGPRDASNFVEDGAAADILASDGAVEDQAVTEHVAAEDPVKDQAVTEHVVAEDPVKDQAVTEHVVADHPVPGKGVRTAFVSEVLVPDQAVPSPGASSPAIRNDAVGGKGPTASAPPDPHGTSAQRRSARRISWGLPPRWVRRCILAPLIVFAAFVWLPLAAWLGVVVAGIVSVALPGRARILRVLFIAGVYLLWDAMALVWMFIMWLGSGFGWKIHAPVFQRAHYRLAGRMLSSLFTAARWTLRLTINVQDADFDALAPGRPIIVVSRHAGPADSFIIVEALINKFRRQPAIVLKDTLQWDPAVDTLLNRIPNRFVTPYRRRKAGAPNGTQAVGSLAAALGPEDALLIFPEGANATPKRRTKRIASLRAAGHNALANRAENMPHVMPPHAGGVLAAMDACPDAAVVMVAHTGLEQLSTVRDIWRELPTDKSITLKGWLAESGEIPDGRRAREEWLYSWWEKIDNWIDEHEPQGIEGSGRAA